MYIIFFLIWVIFNGQLTVEIAAFGLVVSGVMYAFICKFMDYKENYLVDICLIYAMVSFLAVVVLSKVYVGIFEEMRRKMDDSGFEKKKE